MTASMITKTGTLLNSHQWCRSTTSHHLKNLYPNTQARRWTSNIRPKTTPLIKFHEKREARLENFAGFLMPIVYKSQTITSEHTQTRNLASTFDVSHMMQVVIRGKDRHRFLEGLTVADIMNLKLNKCTLSLFTNEHGGIIDDCIISQREDYIHLVSNAGNAEIIWKWLNENLSSRQEVNLERLTGKSLIALQGPSAAKVLQNFVNVELSPIEFMNVIDAGVKEAGLCQIARCGYTGEDGFEISVDSDFAIKLMEILCQHDDVKPAGLGARDTLRLEAGLCLHGHDISDKNTPVEAALSWTVHKRRREEGGFLGSDIVIDQLKNGPAIKRVGLMAVDKGPPAREGSIVVDSKGSSLGSVTSGTFSPVLGKNIAMAYLPSSFLKGGQDILDCIIRGKNYRYRVAKMPFVKSNYYIRK